MSAPEEEDDPKICVCVRCGARTQTITARDWRTQDGRPVCSHCAKSPHPLPRVHPILAQWRDAPSPIRNGVPVEIRAVLVSGAGVRLCSWTADGLAMAIFSTEKKAAEAVCSGSVVFVRRRAPAERKPVALEAAGGLSVAVLAR